MMIQRRENVDVVATRHPQTSSDSLVDVSWSLASVQGIPSALMSIECPIDGLLFTRRPLDDVSAAS